MQYLLLIHASEAGFATMPKEAVGKVMAEYHAYNEVLKKAKVLVAGERLRPSAATSTVRVIDGKTKVQDGPFAETKEQLGGYYLIDVPDLDAALKWAAKCPGAAHGTMEVRPIWPSNESGANEALKYS